MAVRASSTNAAFDAYRDYKVLCLWSRAHLQREIPKLQAEPVSVYTLRALIKQVLESNAAIMAAVTADKEY